jgi:hypothetical protein
MTDSDEQRREDIAPVGARRMEELQRENERRTDNINCERARDI